jgi:hypothetical protein
MVKNPQIVLETSDLRVVLRARNHSSADKVYAIESATKDAMGVATWKHEDIITFRRDELHMAPERKVMQTLLELREREQMGVPGGKALVS